MKTIIAGSKSIKDRGLVFKAISLVNWKVTEIVSANSNDVEQGGIEWANKNNVPYKIFALNHSEQKNIAHSIRNESMAKYADAILAIWDGHSQGIGSLITLGKKYNLTTRVLLESDISGKNEIRSNPVFGDRVGTVKSEDNTAMETLEINGNKFLINSNKDHNTPIVNFIKELHSKVNQLEKEVLDLKQETAILRSKHAKTE